MQAATLCHPVVDGELLSIRDRRGLGAGKLVGPGGNLEGGETPRAAARREVREELRVDPLGLEKAGEFAFHFRDAEPDEGSMHVHVFAADGVRKTTLSSSAAHQNAKRSEDVDGDPTATEEAVPEWHSAADPPYDEMWVTDRVWLPHLLDGESFTGEFVLDEEDESLLAYEMERRVDLE